MTLNQPRWRLASTGAALLLTGLTAAAQDRRADDHGGNQLQLVVGLGAMSAPKYPGSDLRETRALPLISARYGRYFFGGAPGTGVPLGLGVDLVENSPWRFGLVLGPDIRKPRRESDAPQLKGLGDIAATPHAGLFGGYTQGGWILRGNVVTDAGGKHEGTTAGLELEGRYRYTDSLLLSAGPGLSWADQRHTQTYYGINATQAASSGLPRYDVKAGVNAWKFTMGIEYRIDARWFITGRATVERLRGDAKASPITLQSSPYSIGVFSGYRY
jgi:outer membrane protein